MPRDDEARLVRPDDLLTPDELTAEARGALAPGEVERDRELDAARMWTSKDDGLLVRGVTPHSAEKSTLVSRGIDTVSSATSGQWFAVKHGVRYVELYSGPGRLLDESTGKEQPVRRCARCRSASRSRTTSSATSRDNPYYDVLLVSRHDRGLDLRTGRTPVPVDPQLSLLNGGGGAANDSA